MRMLLAVQILLIPPLLFAVVVWVEYLKESRRARRHDPRVDIRRTHLDANEFPHVTICLPARDEEDNVEDCLRSLLAVDYPHFDVIVVDDRSSDATPEILDRLAAADPRLKIIHNTDTAEGWMGKCYALHLAVGHAVGSWLLFVDADTRHHPQCLRACLREAFDHDLDVMSPISGIDAGTFWEKIIMPICGGLLFSRFRLNRTNNPDDRRGFCNGQFFLIKREAYDDIGGHEAVRTHILEDVAFAHNIKKAKRRIRVAWGHDLVTVRMFRTVDRMIEGWARILLGAFGSKPRWFVLMALGSFIVTLLPLLTIPFSVFLLAGGHSVIAACLVLCLASLAALLNLVSMVNVYLLSELPGWYALFAPLSTIFLLRIYARGWRLATGRRNVSLRGSQYSVLGDNPCTAGKF